MEGASRQSLARARAALDDLVGAPSPDAGRVARGVARARAAISGPDLDTISAELTAFAGLLGRELGIRRALTDPGDAPQARVRLLDRLVGGRIGATSVGLLHAMVESRWNRPLDLQLAVRAVAAEALLAQAQLDGSLDDVEDELFRFSRILDRTPRLELALSDPGLPADRKQGLVDRLLAGKVTPVTARLVELAVRERDRGDIGRTIENYAVLAAARRQRTVAVVRVARPLDDAQTERMRAAISRYFGREVQLQVDVDPAVLGGAVVRVGDEVVDGSVARRLDGARRQLLR